jgi:hypothetical protein
MNKSKYIAATLLVSASMAIAGPGAHGPNGEHLDSADSHVNAEGGGPRLETFSETFELVGRLEGGELSIMIDRYDSNQPVLNGKVEVEAGGLKASARFHPDHGDYAVEDERFLKALAQPGKHALLFTISDGQDSDLLEGVLEVGAGTGPAHDEQFPWQRAAAGFGAMALVGLGGWLLARRRKQRQA